MGGRAKYTRMCAEYGFTGIDANSAKNAAAVLGNTFTAEKTSAFGASGDCFPLRVVEATLSGNAFG